MSRRERKHRARILPWRPPWTRETRAYKEAFAECERLVHRLVQTLVQHCHDLPSCDDDPVLCEDLRNVARQLAKALACLDDTEIIVQYGLDQPPDAHAEQPEFITDSFGPAILIAESDDGHREPVAAIGAIAEARAAARLDMASRAGRGGDLLYADRYVVWVRGDDWGYRPEVEVSGDSE
jgi:hypothetical protein